MAASVLNVTNLSHALIPKGFFPLKIPVKMQGKMKTGTAP